MQISKHDAWLFPELRNNGAALYTLFTVGKICRQNVSFELEKPSLFPPSNRSPALFLQFLLLSCIHLTIFHLTSSLPFLPLFQRWVMSVILPCLASLSLYMCGCICHHWGLFWSPISFYIFRSSMYIYGGFSGPLLNDVLAYTPPSCLAFSNPIACAAAGPGVRCHWVSSRCLSWEPKSPEQIVPAAFCTKPTGMLSMSSDSNHLCTSF